MTKAEREHVVRTIRQAGHYAGRGDDAAAVALLRDAFAMLVLRGNVSGKFAPAPRFLKDRKKRAP